MNNAQKLNNHEVATRLHSRIRAVNSLTDARTIAATADNEELYGLVLAIRSECRLLIESIGELEDSAKTEGM